MDAFAKALCSLRVAGIVLCAVMTACEQGVSGLVPAGRDGRVLVVAVPPPQEAMLVAAGSLLQPLIDAAPPGAALRLEPGVYAGPLLITKPLTIWGPAAAVIRSNGSGSTVTIRTNAAALLGVTVEGSGSRYDLLDSAIRVEGENLRVEGVTIRDALFGVLAERSRSIVICGNTILGPSEGPIGMRGDGIRLWETNDSVIAGNVVHHGRDVVVWYSSGNRIMNNSIRHGRYGTHFMYSHGNHVEGNDYSWNTVGIFVMYSRDITIRANRIAHAGGAGGMGIGIKDSGNLDVHANSFFDDTVAIHLDSSPLTVGQRNNFTDNTIRLCATAIYFHSSQRDNYFHRNSFRDNTDLVRVGGGGDAMGVEWCGNHFDIYQGYDLDGDGVGDLPFELRRLTTTLVNRRSELLLFRGTPAFALVDLSSRVSPLYPPQLILRDPQPSMRPPTEARHGG